MDDVNADRSRFEQIKRFTILPRDFSAEEGEVTPTLKLKRRVVEAALRARDRGAVRGLARAVRPPTNVDAYQPVSEEILTTSPVCGAWMKLPPPT